MIRIVLIRHGRTAWNMVDGPGQRFRGTVDLPLAGEGIEQAAITAKRLDILPLAAVYCSPLQRAVHTARIIAGAHGLAPQPLPGLATMNYGDWAGLTYAEVAQRWPDLFRQWTHDPFPVQIPGGESTTALRNRATEEVRRLLARHSPGDTVAIISHQAVTKSLVCAMAGLPNTAYWQIRQDLCNLSLFDYDPTSDRFSVVGLNDTWHLSPALSRSGDGTRILLVRHGQTGWNEGAGQERFRGRTDLPLDDTGQAQARALATRLLGEPISALYASPLLRARQTLRPFADQSGASIVPHDGLIDINYGQFQGLTHAEAMAAFPQAYTQWRTAPRDVRFPAGEGLADVQHRLLSLLDMLAARHPRQTVVLAGHQIVNKVLACTLLGLDLNQIWRVQQDTAGLDLFQRVDGQWHTLCLNDTCHLAGIP